MVGYDHIITQI